jgi:tRNA(Ile)-lysidine synthase
MNNILQHITQKWAHLSTKKIFLACSGGVDSMTLLSIFKSVNWDVEVLHVNYQLRGADSESDQELVQNTCKTLNIPFHLKKIKLQTILDKKGGNLQEIARQVRYDFFEEKRNLSPNNFIALGHHQDDQIETFFMHIARKSGIMGMACMPDEHHQFIRPLLPFSKEEIIHFAEKTGVKWREDYTNKTNKYTRNILRNILLPELQIKIPSLNESVLLLIDKFQKTQSLLEEKVKPILEEIKSTNQLAFVLYDQLIEEEKVEILRQLGQKAVLLKKLDAIRHSQKGKQILLDSSNTPFSSIIREENNFQFILKEKLNHTLPTLYIEEVSQLPLTFSPNEIYIDPSKISGELNVRKWKNGDRMSPIGMKGSKLLSDIIKDAKVDFNKKKDILILEDEKQIVWCIGIRCSKHVIAKEDSSKIWKINLT